MSIRSHRRKLCLPAWNRARLRRQFTSERQLEIVRRTFQREPGNEDELDAFVEEYTRELYNAGADEL